jgi:hypothetical protein
MTNIFLGDRKKLKYINMFIFWIKYIYRLSCYTVTNVISLLGLLQSRHANQLYALSNFIYNFMFLIGETQK